MLILVMNFGSSSIKYKLFEVAHRPVMASAWPKIGESSSILTPRGMTAAEKRKTCGGAQDRRSHRLATDRTMDPTAGVIGNPSEITPSAIGSSTGAMPSGNHPDR